MSQPLHLWDFVLEPELTSTPPLRTPGAQQGLRTHMAPQTPPDVVLHLFCSQCETAPEFAAEGRACRPDMGQEGCLEHEFPGLIHVYFIFWVITYYIICFHAPVVPALASGRSFIWLLQPSLLWFCFLSTSLLSALQDVPGSPCIFPAPTLESAISPRSPIPSAGEWYQKPTFGVRRARGLPFLLGPSNLQSKEISVCAHTHIHKYFHM